MKPSRRTFVKCGVGACAAGAAVRPIWVPNAGLPYYKAVFDERFPEPCRFAIESGARSIPTAAIRGDITRLFFDDLDLRWRQAPVWLTGWTTPASLFCLDLLARDRGMRLSHCDLRPSLEAALRALDGAPSGLSMRKQLPASNSSDLVFWVIAPSARASAKETVNA